MLPLEKQVSNLELSQRLKELKCSQESLWYWCNCYCSSAKLTQDNWYVSQKDGTTFHRNECIYSAFTVAESMEALPSRIGNTSLYIVKMKNGTWCVEYCYSDMRVKYEFGDLILCNALSKMRIYLLENKLLPLEDGDSE